MVETLRFRDIIRPPKWLSDRYPTALTVGYRLIWSMVAALDVGAEVLSQGLNARFPGVGTPTALSLIGRSRGLIRGQNESNEDYVARLLRWLDVHPEAGWDERVARVVHEYLEAHPRVRVVDRAGQWTTVDTDGTVTRTVAAWDWDSVSHPERSDPDEPWWSDLWVIVYSPFPARAGTLGDMTGDDGYALGHMVASPDVQNLKGLFAQWKAAHSRIRAVIWTTDATKFDPATPSSLPDGTWGAWSRNVAGVQVPSNRDTTVCRYWEPR